ncbi:MAG: hypothetical protein LBU09_01655 [Endomicrobium sp.]|jgi:spermidine synthase|nr:hypothetical protein [Endomicrobium sp.]
MQCLLFRELFAVFQGIDIIIGFYAAAIAAAYASGFYAASFFKDIKKTDKFLFFLICLAAAVFAVSFVFIQNIRNFLHIPLGGGISLKLSFFYVFNASFPSNFILAFIFALLADLAVFKQKKVSGKIIFCCAASGFCAASFLYAFFMTDTLGLRLCAITAALMVFSLSALLKSEKDLLWLFGFIAAMVFFINTDFAANADKKLLEQNFKPAMVEDYSYSSYGQTVLAQKNGEYFLLTNNILSFSSPDGDILNSEDFGHIPVLHVKKPEDVLIIGPAAKYAPMILNYGVIKIDYLQADAAISEIMKNNAARFGRSFNDKRLSIKNLNARDFLDNHRGKYDLILIGLDLPSNLRANGFYTKDFFEKAKNNLKADGFIALKLPGRMVYSGYIMSELNASVSKTLKSVFKHVKIIPGGQNIFIASDGKMPFRFEIKKRLAAVLETVLVLSKYYLDDRMDTQKTKWLSAELKKAQGKVSVNSDLNPHVFIRSVLYSQSGFSPRLSVFLDKAAGYSYIAVLLLVLLLFPKSICKTTSFSSGAACATLFLSVLFYSRTAGGQIFKLVPVFCACFVLGICFACFFDAKFSRAVSLSKKIFNCEALFILTASGLYCAMKFSSPCVLLSSLFVFALGFAAGLEFLKLFEFQNAAEKSARVCAAPVYTAAGALAACVLGGSFLIFVWGFERSVLFVLFLKFIIFCRWADADK